MAAPGKLPLFVSAPRCRIKIGDQVIAYAVGLSLNVSLIVEPIKTLGYFTIRSIEPLMVSPVAGNLRIVRLLNDSTRTANALAAGLPANRTAFVPSSDIPAAGQGDVYNAIPGVSMKSAVGGSDGSSILSQGNLYRHMDPASLLLSQTLTIDIWLKVPIIPDTKLDATTGFLIGNTGTPTAPIPTEYTLTDTHFMTIKDCRLTAGGGSFTPNRIYEESFSYQGLLCISHYDASGNPMQSLDTSWTEQPNGGI